MGHGPWIRPSRAFKALKGFMLSLTHETNPFCRNSVIGQKESRAERRRSARWGELIDGLNSQRLVVATGCKGMHCFENGKCQTLIKLIEY